MNTIIVPVQNESERIEKTSGELISFCRELFGKQFQIVFVDDWSRDDTYLKLCDLSDKNINTVRNHEEMGKGSALKYAYTWAKGHLKLKDDDYIIFIDGDGQINPEEIIPFMTIAKIFHSDVVIGNKRHCFSVANYTLKRRILSKAYNFLVRYLFGFYYTDTQCGLKIFRKFALDKVINKVTIKRFAFDIELLVALMENDIRIADAPVTLRKQLNGGSAKLSNILNMYIDTMLVWCRKKQGFYKNAENNICSTSSSERKGISTGDTK